MRCQKMMRVVEIIIRGSKMKIGWPDGWRDGIDSLQSQSVVEYESIEGESVVVVVHV